MYTYVYIYTSKSFAIVQGKVRLSDYNDDLMVFYANYVTKIRIFNGQSRAPK